MKYSEFIRGDLRYVREKMFGYKDPLDEGQYLKNVEKALSRIEQYFAAVEDEIAESAYASLNKSGSISEDDTWKRWVESGGHLTRKDNASWE